MKRRKYKTNYGRRFKSVLRTLLITIITITMPVFSGSNALGAGAAGSPGGGISIPNINISIGGNDGTGGTAVTVQILILLTILSLAPAIVIMVTSFTRIAVVLSLLRQAIGTQQIPPNQILISLSLFITFFIMAPVWTRINSEALQPMLTNQIPQSIAFERAVVPIREFMLKQVREKDLSLFIDMSKIDEPKNITDVPTYVIIPAFMISELKTAFQIGFLLYIPFLVLDMVVASVLMSMGMLMLPPIVISLPFKIMLFVLVDGWYLIIGSIVKSFG
ncbi:MAG: flagellar biosynthetic protein FliP [Nitrospirae bacterium RIFCSPLOW2_12_42_9]|nr:MAG: flagellar biosynthetic protein FliP [Nitrospirae bacterium GWA2_42_11]OGW60970.1 MAG: flagellar biosynthetic protein FliP [Nitrospirae bacterium RIFCSPLOW2_12_42_9]